MKALILCGGTGSRLQPITFTKAKQLIPVANKPVIYYAIEAMAKTGISEIGIIVGDVKSEVIQHVGNGQQWGVNISYIVQQEPLGLAHAVKVAQPFLKEENFLMFLGDNLIWDGLERFIDQFYNKKMNALVVLNKVNDPQKYGVAVLENGDIVELVEKPKKYVSDMAIVGLYIFDKNIFSAIESIKPSWRNELEITDAIQEMVKRGYKVGYSELEKWWKDTGNPRDILEANQRMLDDISSRNDGMVDQHSVLQGKVIIGKDTKVVNSMIRGPAVIGEKNTIRDAYIGPYTAIDRECTIESAEVENSIIMENCAIINIRSRISDSLIGSNVEIISNDELPATASFVIGDKCKIKIK